MGAAPLEHIAMASSKTLSAAQHLILSHAATHPDHRLFPLPAGFHARGAVRQTVLAALVKQGFAVERPTTDDSAVWRRDSRRHRLTLVMTVQGRRMIGLSDEAAPDANAGTIVAPSGKLGSVLSVLATADGGTLAALVTLTGWLPHTTRAALCRLRQRGYPIQLVGEAGTKAYHLDIPAQG
jgi:hypothetical protein